MRIRLTLSYDGTDFSGWQMQAQGERTVQGEITKCLSTIFNTELEVVGCGRTDSGVHARDYVAHSDLPREYDLESLCYKLNKMLKDDIVIHRIEATDAEFHARFDAISRSYEYRLRLDKNPFDNRFTWHYPFNDQIDIISLNLLAREIIRFDDFYTFSKSDTDVGTYLCKIKEARWEFDQPSGIYSFHITADRFLRGMIRLLVGAMLNVNRGKLNEDSLWHCLENKNRLPLDWSVDGRGLCLKNIIYKD